MIFVSSSFILAPPLHLNFYMMNMCHSIYIEVGHKCHSHNRERVESTSQACSAHMIICCYGGINLSMILHIGLKTLLCFNAHS